MRLRLPHIPRSSSTDGAPPLGNRAVDPCPLGRALFALFCLFSVTSPLHQCMLAARLATSRAWTFDRASTIRTPWAGLTTHLGQADVYPRLAGGIAAVRPYWAPLAPRTGDMRVGPINRQTRDIQALPRWRLPGGVHFHWSHPFDAVVGLPVEEALSLDVAPSEQMRHGPEVCLREGAMHGLRHVCVWRGRRGRFARGDPVGPLSLTGCRAGGCVPAPCGLTLLTPPGFGIIRGMPHVHSRRQVLGVAPGHCVILDILWRPPHAPQPCHRRMLPECCRPLRGIDPVEPWPPILANGQRQALPCTCCRGQALRFTTRSVACRPVLGDRSR
jgi:hypothetical protein